MKRNQNRNLGELITIFLDNGDLTEDDVMPLLKKGAASSLKEKEEDIFSQPLTEGEEKSIPERYQELIYAVESKWTNETRHQTALRYIQQAEKTHVEPQESNKEEEYTDGFKIECEHGSRGRCLKCLGIEEPSKKPSDRIKEIYKEGNPWIDCIIEYLDELHNQRNI